MKVQHCIKSGDPRGNQVGRILELLGFEVITLKRKELAPLGSICWYTTNNTPNRAKYFSIKCEQVPAWAEQASLSIGVINAKGPAFEKAVRDFAHQVDLWLVGKAQSPQEFTPIPGVEWEITSIFTPESRHERRKWRERVRYEFV